ncbi:unnamed protein product [Hydatigera taeniaeformis]|uniref:Uncharacterized protein n=1 Tax=Hydatigena taeniaeformis TaxID=6205 RepID=A0A0R3WSB3_HYDTA|nr:unnamed protein product [Hydatigera taeniaeformis]
MLLMHHLMMNLLTVFRLEDLVLSKVPSKTLQSNFIANVYKESEPTMQSGVSQTFATDQDVFKPLVLRSFTTLDDLEVVNQEQAARPSFSTLSTLNLEVKTRPSGGLFGLHLTPLSLGQLRLTLFLIDCYLIVTRFYNTYVILREILVGRRLVVDAASYLSILASLPPEKQENGEVKQEESKSMRYNVFQEETHYQCGHSPAVKPHIVSCAPFMHSNKHLEMILKFSS